MLESARSTEPTQAALDRLYQIYDPTAARNRSDSEDWLTRLRASLNWDSRLQPSTLGVRQAEVDSYRLLYTSDRGDIELMVEPRDDQRLLEGEIVLSDGEFSDASALVIMQPQNQGALCETISSAQGRFSLDSVSRGVYTLFILLIDGTRFEIDSLEIT